jgi:fucose permease
VIAATAPPFPLFVLGYGISGLGSRMMEGSFNTFGATLENSSPILGLLHGCYGSGAVVLSAIGTEMLAKGIPWNRIYLIHVCSVTSNTCSLMLSAYAFRSDVSSKYRAHVNNAHGTSNESNLKAILKSKLVWLLAVIVLLYMGAEFSTEGWTTIYDGS